MDSILRYLDNENEFGHYMGTISKLRSTASKWSPYRALRIFGGQNIKKVISKLKPLNNNRQWGQKMTPFKNINNFLNRNRQKTIWASLRSWESQLSYGTNILFQWFLFTRILKPVDNNRYLESKILYIWHGTIKLQLFVWDKQAHRRAYHEPNRNPQCEQHH